MKIIVYVMSKSEYHEAQQCVGDDHPYISVINSDIFTCRDADCMVTAGNSFGMMDGGIDGAANYQFGMIQPRVQELITEEWRGEIPVGAAIVLRVVPTMHLAFRYLCYAPTMRVPSSVTTSTNAYMAMRGALVECGKYSDIRTLAVPLLCCGAGRMNTKESMRQIIHACETFHARTLYDWKSIWSDDAALRVIQ